MKFQNGANISQNCIVKCVEISALSNKGIAVSIFDPGTKSQSIVCVVIEWTCWGECVGAGGVVVDGSMNINRWVQTDVVLSKVLNYPQAD